MTTNEEKYHPGTVVSFPGTLKDLSEEICDMSYDKVAEFTDEFANTTKLASDNDLVIRNRILLSEVLFEASVYLKLAKGKFDEAWKICEPRM